MKDILKNKGVLFILAGAVLFTLRYIPLLHYDSLLVDGWYSISEASSVCGGFLSGLINECSWVVPLNTILITLAIMFFLYGVFLVYQEQKK